MTLTHCQRRLVWPSTWSITVKVPLLVALLMFIVSAIITNRVLSRLEATQEKHLTQLASGYLDGLSAALAPHVVRHDVWEVFDALERGGQGYKGLDLIWTTVVTPDGSIVASSNPRTFGVDTQLTEHALNQFTGSGNIIIDKRAALAHVRRSLTYKDREIGVIYAEVGIAQLLAERRDVLFALLLTNGLLTLALAAIGYAAVRWLMRHVKMLSDHLGRSHAGAVKPIPVDRMPPPQSDFGRVFQRYNAMAMAVNEREALTQRLAKEEKLASLGRLTSGMAHEINNPLGGMLNAIDALERHGDHEHVRRTSVGLLKRGLTGIRDVVRAALMTYRKPQTERPLQASDLDDLKFLIAPEVRRKSLKLAWENAIDHGGMIGVTEFRQALLNLLLNACAAAPHGGNVRLTARSSADRLEIVVSDDGPGMPDSLRSYLEAAEAPAAPIMDGAGLGIWMVRRWIDEVGGHVRRVREDANGTVIRLYVPLRREETRRVA
ncbi:MAG: HAMP domain-containing histidine kinase [Hyphomicrobiaceae bacterium]|nr:MAG: HAMP domain-containing histidine kinase [Hyphomicrobiaceae bacterium]